MSEIGGKRREQKDFSKKVGLFEASVIAVNPDAEEYKDLLGIDLKEDSKATEYLGTSNEGNPYVRVDVWLEEVKEKERFKVTFFLENKERENKDMTKKQYINAVGACCWADDPNNLPSWFVARDYRVAYVGEEDLYKFMRTWLGNLDYRSAETTLDLDWKKLLKGNVKDIRDQIGGEWCTNVVAMATVNTKEKDGEVKEYQTVYNRGFLPPYSLKNFRLVDYSNDLVQANLKKKKELKPHERFVLDLIGEYGCKDFFYLKDMKEYDPNDNLVATDKALEPDSPEY